MMRLLKYTVACVVAVFFVDIAAQAQWQSGYSSLYDSETVSALKEEVGYVASAMMEGRAPGSEGERMTAEYVWEKLKEYGVEMLCAPEGDVFGIAQGESGARLDDVAAGARVDTLTSRNIVGFIQGRDKDLRGRYIVVGARMDNLGVNKMTVDGVPVDQIYYGANGNASGLAVMLELARMLKTNELLLRRSVIFVGFGASTNSFAGAWYFLNRSFKDVDKVDAMINLDMLGTADNGLYAYTASNTDMNEILKVLEGELQPVRPKIVTDEPYPSDHRAFYGACIPSVFLTSGRYPEHNSYKDSPSIIDFEMLEKVLEYSYNMVMEFAGTSKPMDFRPSSLNPKKADGYSDVVSYNDCDIKPMFLNSQDPNVFLEKWVYAYLKYPKVCVEEGIQGRVLVDFIIEKDGSVSNVRVVRSVDGRLDDEAVRVISASPKWKSGWVGGQRVRTYMTFPVEFRLEKKGSFGVKK